MKTRYLILLLGYLFLQFQSIFSQTGNNSLYIPPTDCMAGSIANIPVQLSNDAEVVAIQFKLHIPDVVQVATSGIRLTDRKEDHIVTLKAQGGNNYLVVVYSPKNTPLRGNSGALLEIPLEIPKNLAVNSVYPFTFSEVALSNKSGENVMTSVNNGSIKIVPENKPDITVRDIKVTPTNVHPGGNISISWKVENIGNRPTNDGWNEQVYLVDENENESLLGRLSYTELLPASGSVSRQADFKVSDFPGIEGKVYAKVKLLPYPNLGESPAGTANNEATSSSSVIIPKILSMKINRNPIPEAYTSDVYCFLNRSGIRKQAETFVLTNSNSKRLQIPASVTIPAGESGVSFTVRTIDDAIANPDSFVTVKVSGNNYPELSQLIWIEDDEMPKLTLSAPAEDKKEGDSFQLTIEREWATAGTLAIKLATEHPKRFKFEQNIVIPANQKSVTVNVQAIDDDLPDVTIDAVFTATAAGFENGTGFVKLLDNDIPDIEMEITPASFSEAAGPQAALATLRRTKVTDNRITVKLTDNANRTLYYPSSSITLEKGATEYQFTIGVVDNDLKEGDRKVKLTAAVYISSCSCSAAGTSAGSVSKELLITDDDGPALKVISSHSSLIEGKEAATTLTISRNTSSEDALTVNLSCDKPDEVTFTKTVVIPAGKTSVDIPVSAKTNTTTEGNRTITFTASAEGFSKGTCWAMITDQTLPDAVISTIKTQTTDLQAKGGISVEMSIGNTGAAALPSQTKVAVYLSNNTQLSSASYKETLGNLYTQKVLEPGQSETLKKTFTLPDKTGAYYIIASVNEEQNQKELIYINNTSGSVAVTLNALYRVQVSTNKTVYKPGDAIVITGQTTGGTVANVPVDLYIINNGYRQSIDVTTDTQGIFQHTFKPEDWQMGHFSIGACYPGEALKEEMAGFNLYGLKKTSPANITCEVVTNQVYKGEISLSNPGTLQLSNIKTELISAPANCKVAFEPVSPIEGNGSGILKYTITGSAPSEGTNWEQIKARISSAEGATMDILLYYYCRSEKGELVSEVPSINTTMTTGASRDYQLHIANTGKGETGKITVNIPGVPWMTLASPKEMSSLKYGETTTILLRLEPTADLALNVPVTGTIGVNCANGKGFSMPFHITPVSESTGTLKIDVCDEYTYNTKEAPHVANAKVRITTPTNKLVAEGVTGKDGLFVLPNIAEGYYTIEVTADKHDSYKNTILIDPGKDNEKVVNLSFQAITYSWNVVETGVEDQYDFKTEVKYETNIPVPVVVTEMPKYIPVDELSEERSLVFNVILTNKGLVTANNVMVIFPENLKQLNFELLADDNIDLKAQETVTIPVKVTKKGIMTRGDADETSLPCIIAPVTMYHWKCGEDHKWQKTNVGIKLYSVCPQYVNEKISPIYTIDDEQLLNYLLWRDNVLLPQIVKAYEPFYNMLSKMYEVSEFIACDPKFRCVRDLSGSIGFCVWGFIDGGCTSAAYSCATSGFTNAIDIIHDHSASATNVAIDAISCSLSVIGCLGNGAGMIGIVGGRIINAANCLITIGKSLHNCYNAFVEKKTKSSVSALDEFIQTNDIAISECEAYLGAMNEILGPFGIENCEVDEWQKIELYLKNTKPEEWLIGNRTLMDLKPKCVSVENYTLFIQRLRNTFTYYTTGSCISDNYIKVEVLKKHEKVLDNVKVLAKNAGYESFADMYEKQKSAFIEYFQEPSSSVCSSVSLQFSQTMLMTRQAFRGTLTVFNGHETEGMKDVKLDLTISDKDGIVATSHEFQISPESLINFSGDLNGAWTLNAQKTGSATILFIPSKHAAPKEPKEYTFGGTLSYEDPFTGLVVTKDLYPVTMTVKPSPNLDMTYFMQRDILGDDPLTVDKVEPTVPAEFSLLIHNIGTGDATNINMVTNQPEIIDNEKGLNIRFELLSSQLNGKDQTLALGGSVATTFGTIPAGKTAYAQWWFKSSLLGHFTDYDVKATHVTSYDNPDLSLLDTVTIHELIRSIKVPKTELVGFLANDIVDAEDLPDMLYLSDGTIEKVATTTNTSIAPNGTYQYLLTVTPAESGWNYGSISDPTNGRQKLTGIVRVSDGATIDTRNIWQTSCTLRDGKEHLYENRIHFADKMGTAQEQYRLTFEPGPDIVLEVSALEGAPEGDTVTDKPITEVTVRFNKAINASTFTMEDLTLALQGENQDAGLIAIQKVNEQTFVLDLSALTKRDGYYVLTVQTADITDAEGYNGDSGKSIGWVQYLAPGSQTLTLPLSTGWNWISTNMENSDNPVAFLAPVKDKVNRMQSQSQELINDPKYGLTGSLKAVDPKSAYKLQMIGNGSINVTGTALTPELVTIELNKGWNWIGYIPRLAATPTTALSLLKANTNDEIKGQGGFAKFNGTNWVGTLTRMTPGEGYMYFANAKHSFRYATIYNSLQSPILKAMAGQAKPWTVDRHKYPNNMSIVADLWEDKIKQESDIYTVGAFVGEECRGIGQYVDGILFITVYGEKSNEKVSFRAVKSGSSVEWSIRETLSFGETSQGTLSEPYALHLSGLATSLEEVDHTFGIYPNPVNRILYFKGDYSDIKQITILSMNGMPALRQEMNGQNSLDVSTLPEGIYILIIQKGEKALFRKMIKVNK